MAVLVFMLTVALIYFLLSKVGEKGDPSVDAATQPCTATDAISATDDASLVFPPMRTAGIPV